MQAAGSVSLAATFCVLTFSALSCAEVNLRRADGGADAGAESSGAGMSPTPYDALPGDFVPTAQFIVYAHTADKLFAVDPNTMEVTLIGPFMKFNPLTKGITAFVGVTDIAVDHNGRLNGLTASEVLRIDPNTAECTTLASIEGERQLNGLSWVTIPGGEVLLATAGDGSVFRLDPATGAATLIGALGTGLVSSGDLVSVSKYGTLVTVKHPIVKGDFLARMNPATGVATVIGPIGFNNVWGIGFWRDRVFGFNTEGNFLLIDPDTGAGTLSQTFPDRNWWGAGVSTAVFVVP